MGILITFVIALIFTVYFGSQGAISLADVLLVLQEGGYSDKFFKGYLIFIAIIAILPIVTWRLIKKPKFTCPFCLSEFGEDGDAMKTHIKDKHSDKLDTIKSSMNFQ